MLLPSELGMVSSRAADAATGRLMIGTAIIMRSLYLDQRPEPKQDHRERGANLKDVTDPAAPGFVRAIPGSHAVAVAIAFVIGTPPTTGSGSATLRD
jgi:hypothetical protein